MIKLIGEDFYIPDIDWELLDTIPVSTKIQGQPVSAVYPGLHWMTYSVYEGGRISFTRNTKEFLPEIVDYTAQYLRDRFPKLPIFPERIHFLQTKGKIREHRDEAGRVTSINIGIKNTSTAITRFGVDDSYETFQDRYVDYICKDNCAYLLDTSKLHSVISLGDDVRTLITMTVTDSYEKTLQYLT